MIQKRINGHQSHLPPKASFVTRESEGQRFRYLTDLPQYSAVLENHTTKNMCASDVSLLQKMAVQNDKMCDSSLFQDQKENGMDTKMVEEMRFSFSNNDPIEIDNKSSHCSDQFGKLHHEPSKSKSKFLQIDNDSQELKRRKDAIKEEIMNQSIETIKNKYIFNQKRNQKSVSIDDAKSKAQDKSKEALQNRSMDSVFNKVLIDVKKDSARDRILPLSKQNLPTIKEEPILNTNNSLDKIVGIQREPINPRYLSVLFELLDRSKTGKIDRYNCNILAIKEELQLILGVIFYRIKFNSEGFTKKDFIQMCLQCIKLLGPHTPLQLFKDLDPHCETHRSGKDQPQNCKSQSKFQERGVSLYHLLDSPPKEKAAFSRTDQQASISLTKSPYVNLKQTRYENNKIEEKSRPNERIIVKQDKYAGKYIKQSQYSHIALDNVKNSDEKKYETAKIEIGKIQQSPRYTFRDKENYSLKYITNPQGQALPKPQQKEAIPKKKRNISEQILQEHKKNLEQLQKLNEKMEKYIYHRPESQNHPQSKLQTEKRYASIQN